MNNFSRCVLVAAVALTFGCGDDDGPPDPVDGGNGDAPVFMPPDTGLMLRDSGMVDTSVSECMRPRLEPPPEELLPRCSAETRDCVMRCPEEEDGCADLCWAADETPADPDLGACGDCVIFDLLACMDAGGCDQEVAEIFCCGERECPPGSAEDCFDVMCQPQLQALFTCGLGMAPGCFEELNGEGACYDQTPLTDAGVPDDAGAPDAAADAGADAGASDAGAADAGAV